jgi:hypothetical protein
MSASIELSPNWRAMMENAGKVSRILGPAVSALLTVGTTCIPTSTAIIILYRNSKNTQVQIIHKTHTTRSAVMTHVARLSGTGTDPWWLYHSHFLGFITMFSKKNSTNPGLIYI